MVWRRSLLVLFELVKLQDETAAMTFQPGCQRLCDLLIIDRRAHSLTCPPPRETVPISSICLLYEKRMRSAGPECRLWIHKHVEMHKIMYVANLAALPLRLLSLWSGKWGQGRHIHRGTSGNAKKDERFENGGGDRGGWTAHMEFRKVPKRVMERGKKKGEEVSISHSVCTHWAEIRWPLASFRLAPQTCQSNCSAPCQSEKVRNKWHLQRQSSRMIH